MRSSTLILLPDQFSDPIRIIRVDDGGKRVERYASLTDIRTGEDGTGHPSIRRYETGDTATAHLTDLVNSRVVITDQSVTSTPGGARMPEWARRNTALHPDRHDLATWLEAAQRDDNAPWVSHLALVVRDALRHLEQHHPATLAIPDRAFLAASADDAHAAIAPFMTSFADQVHEIDENGHRTEISLAPMPLATVNQNNHREAVITRSQAVLAEALVNAIDAQPIPTATDIQLRWETVVTADHSRRLRLREDGTYSAPIALLDDHNNSKFTATLILATVRIALGKDANDIWLEYHTAYDINASRPFDTNLATALLKGAAPVTQDQTDLIVAIQEQALPVLELSTTPSGEFSNRDLISAIPDASPLLRNHPGFSFPEAILAFMVLRDPETFQSWWSKLFARQGQGGEEEQDGAGSDQEVADRELPPEQRTTVSQAEKTVGDEEQDAPDDDDQESGTDGVGDAAPVGDDVEPDAEANHDANETGDETATDNSEGPMEGSGQARLDPPKMDSEPPTEGEQAKEIADALAGADADDQDDDIDMFGAGSDQEVADQAQSSDQQDGSDANTKGSDPEKAHDDEAGTVADELSTISALLASASDTDRGIVEEIRKEVAKKKKAGVTKVPADAMLKDKLAEKADWCEKVWTHVNTTFTTPGDAKLADVRRCLNTQSRWLRLLFLLNLVQQINTAGVTQVRSAKKALVQGTAQLTLDQCEVAKVAVPAEPMTTPRSEMGGVE